jgi:serine/threonine-protein kinase
LAKVGKYELVRKLATGGMAEVFLARFEWARGLEKTVVVKRILYHLAEDPSFIEMFFSEAQLAAQLSHPNIAQIIEFGESEGVHFLSMEYVDGPSLRSLSASAHAEGGGLPYPHCARIAAFCCEALTHAHELSDPATGKLLNLVHRDVSPDNILISKTGSVKLVDFGIAKAATQRHQTKTGLVKGKLAYMAPEQLRAQPLDRRADVFSLGAVLYELVAGAKPFDAESEVALMHAILYEEMVPLRTRRPDVPEGLERIVQRAMERDRDRRYADCRAMHADLEEYLLSARQPVSALQLAELVERHKPMLEIEGAPQPALATPDQPGPAAKTPEPWRAERTPAGAPASQLQEPRERTGTYGGDDHAAPAPRETPAVESAAAPVEKKGMVPARRSREKRAPAAPAVKSRVPLILAVASGVALLAVASALLWPSPSKKPPQEPQPEPLAQKPAVAPEVPATIPDPQEPSTPPPPPQARQEPSPPLPRQIDLTVTSEPPGTIKVFVGGKLKATQRGQVTARVLPGAVEIEVTGSIEQSFTRRESLQLEGTPRKQEHKITVGQGTVMIRSIPASHVTVDGVAKGDVPLKLTLYEGPHTVHFECDRTIPKCAGGLDATQTIVVHPGKESRVDQLWP